MMHYDRQSTNFGGRYLVDDEGRISDPAYQIVTVCRLDDYLSDRRISFVKIDVEGAERKVVSGGQQLLLKDRPTVLAELRPEQLHRCSGSSADGLITQFSALGYRCLTIDGQEFTSYKDSTPTNALFVPLCGGQALLLILDSLQIFLQAPDWEINIGPRCDK